MAYSFKAETYFRMEKWDEGTDDLIRALDYNRWDEKAGDLVTELEEPARTMFITKLKLKSAKTPNEAYWPNLLALMYAQKNEFDIAIDFFKQAIEIDADPNLYAGLAYCYASVGNYRGAIKEIDLARQISARSEWFQNERNQ